MKSKYLVKALEELQEEFRNETYEENTLYIDVMMNEIGMLQSIPIDLPKFIDMLKWDDPDEESGYAIEYHHLAMASDGSEMEFVMLVPQRDPDPSLVTIEKA